MKTKNYNVNMKVTNYTNKELIKFLLVKENILQVQLLALLKEKKNKKIFSSVFSNKYKLNSFKFSDIQEICDVMGYDIILEKRK